MWRHISVKRIVLLKDSFVKLKDSFVKQNKRGWLKCAVYHSGCGVGEIENILAIYVNVNLLMLHLSHIWV